MPDVRRPPRRPIAFAHRGASAHARENTLAAFRLAIDLGATGLESDAWLAADGVPVLVHDRTVIRPGRRLDVTRLPAAALETFGIPTLAALYAAVGTRVELSLDLEHEAVALPALGVAHEAGAIDRLWACSPDVELLARLRSTSGEVRLVCSTRPRRIQGGVESLVPALARRSIDALNMHWRDWTARTVDAVHAAGLLVFGWDAQDATSIERLLDLEVDGIYSDWPERIVSAVARREARVAAGS
jgi:glycerophosphoryl diester phosphodiesterase